MGRIKTQLIKRTTQKLVNQYPDRFVEEFEPNKKAVAEILPDANKKLRNIVAGYCTRLTKQRKKIAV